MASNNTESERRRAPVPALKQPVEPATVRVSIGGREVLERGEIVELTDRTIVVEVADPTAALAMSVAHTIELDIHFEGATRHVLAEPGRRSSDNPTSRRVELVLREIT